MFICALEYVCKKVVLVHASTRLMALGPWSSRWYLQLGKESRYIGYMCMCRVVVLLLLFLCNNPVYMMIVLESICIERRYVA